MPEQRPSGPIPIILLSAFVALLLLAGLLYGVWHWFSHSGELGDKEKYSAIQIVDAEYKGHDINGKFLVLRNVGDSHMTLLGIPNEEPNDSLVWVVLNQYSYDGRVIMVPIGAQPRPDCGQLIGILKQETPLPDVEAKLRKEMKCSLANTMY